MSQARARFVEIKHRQPRSGSGASGGLCFALLALAIILLGWRTITVFTTPPSKAAPSAMAAMVETITGPGRARIAQGADGAFLILIDGPVGALASGDVAKLRALAAALAPDAPPAIINQYPFAAGTPLRPGQAALGEIGALCLLVVLAGWLALTLPHKAGNAAPVQISPQPDDHHTARPPALTARNIPASAPPLSPVEKAAHLAQTDPEATAAIIRKWLRQEEGHA